jgi:dolichyl-phosphate beta-glucosyltransferase
MPKVSVIIPNYNEHENLARGVLDEVATYLKKAPFSYEVIISDDGSSDSSPAFIADFVKGNKNFKLLKNSHGGKAAAVWAGIQEAAGDVIIFSDMDQSTPLKELEKLLPFYEEGYDVVFGSRGRMRDNFPIHRQLMSWGFRMVRQIFLLRGIIDTQCGFKSMRRDVALEVFPLLQIIRFPKTAKGWSVSAFDVELLFLAQKRGYRLKEVDVVWKDRDISKGKQKNLIHESLDMLKQIFRVSLNDYKGRYN